MSMHTQLAELTGGSNGLRDEDLLESAISSPLQTYGGAELYPTLMEKAVHLGYSLICNHPFIDGNKRIGTHTMLVVLALNGISLSYDDEELVRIIYQVAAGDMPSSDFQMWIEQHASQSA